MKRRLIGVETDLISISHTLHMLAGMMKDQNMLMESESLYRESIEVDQRLYGNDCNMHTTKKLLDLGVVLRDRGCLEEAEGLIRESLNVRKREEDYYVLDEERVALCSVADCALVRSMLRFTERLYSDCVAIPVGTESEKDASITRNYAFHLQKLSQALFLGNKVNEARMHFLKCLHVYTRL